MLTRAGHIISAFPPALTSTVLFAVAYRLRVVGLSSKSWHKEGQRNQSVATVCMYWYAAEGGAALSGRCVVELEVLHVTGTSAEKST